jgi:hypothetical protein
MDASRAAARQCPVCHLEFVPTAHARGRLEDICFVLGGELWRCLNCEARQVFLWGFALPVRKTNPAEAYDGISTGLVIFAIVGGILTCLMIALYTLRRFHRWPF